MGQEATVLGGRYELQTEIARGAIGTVWRARDLTSGEPVAVKVLLPEAEHDPDVVKSLLDEAQLLAELNHPGIVRARDVVANGVHALVMDLVEGADVRQRIRTSGPLRPAEVAEIGAQTADALAAVHAAGILHGDVKPGNILMPTDGGPVKLGDFGVARRIQLPDTVTHATPEYVAPEVVAGVKPGPSSDVYSLGMVLYEMTCGRSPYRGGTVAEVIERHAGCVPVQPAGMSDELWQLVLRCVELNPAARPTAGQVAGELRWMTPRFIGRPAAALLPEYASTYRPRLIDPAAPASAAPASAAPISAALAGAVAPTSPAVPAGVPADGPLWPDAAVAFPDSAPTSPGPVSAAPGNPGAVSGRPVSGTVGASPVSAGPAGGEPGSVRHAGTAAAGQAPADHRAAPTSVLSLFDKSRPAAGAAAKRGGGKAPFIAVAAALFVLVGVGVGLMIWAGTSGDQPEAKAPATSPSKQPSKPAPSDTPASKPSPSTPPQSPQAPPNQPGGTQPGDNNGFADNGGGTGSGTGSGGDNGGGPGLGDPMPTMPR
jgi:serine/threonine-protein kinase